MSRGTPGLRQKYGWGLDGKKPLVIYKRKKRKVDLESALKVSGLDSAIKTEEDECPATEGSKTPVEELNIKTNLNPGSFTPQRINES